MTMGTNEQAHPRSRTRSSKRDAAIYGFAGMMSAVVFVVGVSAADAWYMILGMCIIAIMAVVYVAKAIIALRRDDYAVAMNPDE